MTQQQPFPYDAANPLLAPVPTTFTAFFEEVPLQALITKLEKGRDRLKSGIILPGTPTIKIPNQKMNGQGS